MDVVERDWRKSSTVALCCRGMWQGRLGESGAKGVCALWAGFDVVFFEKVVLGNPREGEEEEGGRWSCAEDR